MMNIFYASISIYIINLQGLLSFIYTSICQLNSFVFFFDSPSKTLNRLLTYEYFGYPKDFLLQYQKQIAAVTRADVLRVMKEHIRPEDLTVVAVGNPKDFGKPLTAAGKVEKLDLTIPEPKGAGK